MSVKLVSLGCWVKCLYLVVLNWIKLGIGHIGFIVPTKRQVSICNLY